MNEHKKSIKTLLVSGIALLSMLAGSATPAMAVVSDPKMAARIESSRRYLQTQEQQLLREIDSLYFQLRGIDPKSQTNYDIQRIIDQKYRDLNLVRMDIKDINRIQL
jgi:hypothetical protein